MKITVERSYLANAIATAKSTVSSRNSLAILSNILFTTKDDRVELTATDLDTAIRVTVPCTVHENGSVALPAGVLGDIINKLPDAPITLEEKDGKTSVRSGKSDYTILSLPAEDFPVTPEVKGINGFTVSQSVLANVLKHTTFAASKEESRSILMGVQMVVDDNFLKLTATDTHRLAQLGCSIGYDSVFGGSIIVPFKALEHVAKMLHSDDEEISVIASDSQVQFTTGDVTLVSRLIDGQFPNCEKVIPKNPERKITFDRKEFLDALKRVDIVAKNNSQKAILSAGKDVVKLTAESQDVGKAYEEVPVVIEGTPITIAFNAKYLIEVLGLVSGEEVTLELSGALNPGLLRVKGVEGFLYVVMPMQV